MIEKQVAIAQTLYFMSVHDKTQGICFLFPKKKKILQERLTMYDRLINWLCSNHPLPPNEVNFLLDYINAHPSVFPPVADKQKSVLAEAGSQIDSRYCLENEGKQVIRRMREIITMQEYSLSHSSTITSRSWITSFHAFHNLPRAFFTNKDQGLWHISISPLSFVQALQFSTPIGKGKV